MPDYSKVSKQRDVFGEIGWVPNFNVKKSKNNSDRHHNYREFFDTPKNYNLEFIQSSKQSDFYTTKTRFDDSFSVAKSAKSRSPSL